MKKYTLLAMTLLSLNLSIQTQEDKHQWLEEVDGQNAIDYVNTLSQETFEKLSHQKDYQEIYESSLEIYNSTERIPYPSIKGKHVYNFWKDKEHVRGIWRRCLIESYESGTPQWETLLDIDELSKNDDIKWVYKGSNGLYPDYDRFMVQLSKGGGDAVITREFDVLTKQFVENGFSINESKGSVSFLDKNTLIVSSNFGDGTMTTSGYPRQVKIWKRGTELKNAPVIFEGKNDDVGIWGSVLRDGSKVFPMIT